LPAMLLPKCTPACFTSSQGVSHQVSNAQCTVLQDVVTRGGKFFFLYKRPGHRVIVNDGGHMMVSPSSIEASVHASLAGVCTCVWAPVRACVCVCVCVCARVRVCRRAPDVLFCKNFAQLVMMYWQAKHICWRGIIVWHRLKAESFLDISSV